MADALSFNGDSSAPFPEPPVDGQRYGGTHVLFREAARQFGVKPTEQEDYDWIVILGAAMLVDHLVDVERTDIVAPVRTIVAGTIRQDLNADIQTRTANYVFRQTAAGQQLFFDRIRRVNELAEAQREATAAREVIDIRRTEADIFSAMLSLSILDESDAAARINFNLWLNSWAKVGYLVDSLIDVAKDYKNGESGVPPTLGARLLFAAAVSIESATALRRTPPKLLGTCALYAFKDIFNQKRVKLQNN